MCIDPSEVVKIRGKNDLDSVSLNINFMVCNPNENASCSHKELGEVQNYLTYPEYVLIYNENVFN